MRPFCLFGPLLLLLLLLLPGPTVAAPPSAAQLRTGRRLARTAAQQYREGRYAAAAEGYLLAYATAKEPLTLKNAIKIFALHVGDCAQTLSHGARYLASRPDRSRAQEVSGYMADCRVAAARALLQHRQFGEAREVLGLAMALDLAAPARAKVQEATQRLSEEEDKERRVLVSLVAKAEGGGALTARTTFLLDGKPVRPDRQGRVQVSRGPHLLQARAVGYRPGETAFSASEGAVAKVLLRPNRPPLKAPEPAGSEPKPTPSLQRQSEKQLSTLAIAGWSALGLGLAAALAGGGVDLWGASTVAALNSTAREGKDRDKYDSLRSEVDSARVWTAALYGTAALAAAAGGTLLYLGVTDGSRKVAVVPAGAGASVCLRW